MKSVISALKRRRNTGFTLVEMVVSVALLAILIGGMMVFISPIIRSFNDNKTDLTAENAATCVQEYITRSLRSANQVAIFTNTNKTALAANSAYTNKIKTMNEFCSSVNGLAVNKTYVLKCISLIYDETTGNYSIYCDDQVDITNEGVLSFVGERKVFSDCLFDDLYLSYDFAKPKNGDYLIVEDAPEYRGDALELTIRAYRDSDRNSLAFYGTGITELRMIKVMLAAGDSPTVYNLTIEPSSPLPFESTTAGSRDIFIYYVVRQLGVIT